MKKVIPQNVYIHNLLNGETSFNIYIRVQKRNIIKPGSLDNLEYRNEIFGILCRAVKDTGRPINFIGDFPSSKDATFFASVNS